MKPDTESIEDRGEAITMMEPLLISGASKHRSKLSDLAVELTAHSAGFRRSLPNGILNALADLVRSMNCYYSNLIEGHDTHPIDFPYNLHRSSEIHGGTGTARQITNSYSYVGRRRNQTW